MWCYEVQKHALYMQCHTIYCVTARLVFQCYCRCKYWPGSYEHEGEKYLIMKI